MNKNHITIVIPAYNEELNIRRGALDKVFRYMERTSYSWDVIVVNDGSTDVTMSLLKEMSKTTKKLTVIDNPHMGKAGTLITGMNKAAGDIVIFSDLDQATPISEIEKVLPWFEKGFDVVIGSRNRHREGAPVLRLIMARGFMILRSVILGMSGITDTQCGFKAFSKAVVRQILPKLKRYGQIQSTTGSNVTAGFDIELLFLAKKLSYKIKEVPVEWHYVETRRVNPLKDSLQGFIDIVSIRLNAVRGKYD